jgi:hypothetical protein
METCGIPAGVWDGHGKFLNRRAGGGEYKAEQLGLRREREKEREKGGVGEGYQLEDSPATVRNEEHPRVHTAVIRICSALEERAESKCCG